MLKTRPLRVLWHGEFGLSTGFAGVSQNILDRLNNIRTEWGTKKYEIVVMALGLQASPFENYNVKPYKIVPMYGNRGAAPFGHDYAADMVRRFKPDVVVTFGDTWMCDFWNDGNVIPPDLRKSFKLVGYIAIDGYPVPKFWIDKYQKFDKILTFTKFGKDAIEERAEQMARQLDVNYIYHGVDTQLFKPLPKSDVDNFKQSRGIDPKKKIIGMFSRNQPRKHHPEFIEFASYLLEKTNNNPDYLFYLHAVKQDAGWDLDTLIEDIDSLDSRNRFLKDKFFNPGQSREERKASLKSRFIFPGIDNPANGYPIDLLNMMYNICDVHVLLTSGEGFGCTLLESMSAGIPTFTNDYAAGGELVRESKAGEPLNAREYTYRGSDHNFYRPHTDYEDTFNKVMNCLNNPDVATKYKKKARAFALAHSWDVIIDDWDRELTSLYNLNNKQIIPVEV